MLNQFRNDRGAAAILVAMSLFLLMGMAAIAVDTGIAFSDRRQQQSAADTAALAAVQFAKTSLPTSMCGAYSGANLAVCRGAEEAMTLVDANLPDLRYDSAAWAECLDPTRPKEYTRYIKDITRCISFTDDFHKARVALPGTAVETTFGRILGRNTIRVSAFAEAGFELVQSAEVLPFAVGPTGQNSNQTCLFANSAATLNVSPCDGPVDGNFGKLDVSIYGNSDLGTSEECGNAKPQSKMAINIVVGADHPLEEASESVGTVDDIANCNAGPISTNPADHLHTQTGNAEKGLFDGLLGSISTPAREGRLRCKTAAENDPGGKVSKFCVDVNNNFPESLDDTPLWVYINSSDTHVSIFGSCSGVNTRSEMESCLAEWRAYGAHPVSSSLFTGAIVQAPRFGAVPILESDPGNGSGDYDILDFSPTYIETLYLSCTANTCAVVFSPGEDVDPIDPDCPAKLDPGVTTCGLVGTGNKKVYAMTSFMLTLDMLPEDVRKDFPSKPGTLTFNLSR